MAARGAATPAAGVNHSSSSSAGSRAGSTPPDATSRSYGHRAVRSSSRTRSQARRSAPSGRRRSAISASTPSSAATVSASASSHAARNSSSPSSTSASILVCPAPKGSRSHCSCSATGAAGVGVGGQQPVGVDGAAQDLPFEMVDQLGMQPVGERPTGPVVLPHVQADHLGWARSRSPRATPAPRPRLRRGPRSAAAAAPRTPRRHPTAARPSPSTPGEAQAAAPTHPPWRPATSAGAYSAMNEPNAIVDCAEGGPRRWP